MTSLNISLPEPRHRWRAGAVIGWTSFRLEPRVAGLDLLGRRFPRLALPASSQSHRHFLRFRLLIALMLTVELLPTQSHILETAS